MPQVFVSIHRDDPEPAAFVLGHHSDDGPFITFSLGSVSVYVRGYRREAAANARLIAEQLVKAADEVDAFENAVARRGALEGGRS